MRAPWIALLVAATALLLGHTQASAQARAHVVVDGACPTQAALTAALRSEGVATSDKPDASWLVRVAPVKGRARLELRRPNGLVVLSRQVSSVDCSAIADVYALVIAAHIQSTNDLPGEAAPTTSPTPEPRAVQQVFRLPLKPPAAHQPARHSASAGDAFSFGVVAGLDTGLNPTTMTTFTQLDVAWLRRARWGARAALARDAATNDPMLQRGQTMASVEVVRLLSATRVWLSPGAGAGLVFSTVSAEGEQIRRLHPALTGTVAGGIRITNRISFRAEIGGQLFPVADTYRSGISGEIGKSPRGLVSMGFGLQIDTKGW